MNERAAPGVLTFAEPSAIALSDRRGGSTCSAPIRSPQLPLASRMNTGAVQRASLRQLITPEPYSPPNTKATFFIEGIR